MSISAAITNHIQFSGDQTSELAFGSGALSDSPCIQQLITLAIGDNTITLPDIEDFTVHGVVIVPPLLNATELVLKGIAADTGIPLSASRVSIVQLGDILPVSIVIEVDAEIVGLRLIWF